VVYRRFPVPAQAVGSVMDDHLRAWLDHVPKRNDNHATPDGRPMKPHNKLQTSDFRAARLPGSLNNGQTGNGAWQ
jgi:hypothetical protein